MLIGQENQAIIDNAKFSQRVNSAQQNYSKLRHQDRIKDLNNTKINFNADYNQPLLKQYGQNKIPGPDYYNPRYNNMEKNKAKQQTFNRQQRMYSQSDRCSTPSVFDYNSNLNKLKYDNKRAVSFAKSQRVNTANINTPGVGSYNTNKQFDLMRGHGARIPQSQYKMNDQRVQTPGVGSYKVKKETFNKGYPKFSNENRFNSNLQGSTSFNSLTPGVGNYNLEKSYNISSFKGNINQKRGGVIPTQGRFGKRINQMLDGPSPMDYNLPGHFDKLNRNKLKSAIHLRRNQNPINIIV